MADQDLLDIVDDNDNVVGQATRKEIHEKGLQHREIHVWLVTPKREVIFQKRGPNKDTYPNLLDATVGGHVDAGKSRIETALQELEEETGLVRTADDLQFVNQDHSISHDPVTGAINNRIQSRYVLIYTGSIDDLRIEEGKASGFEAWPIDRLHHLSPEERSHFIPGALREERLKLYEQMADMVIAS